jgi:hypothetical protein
MERPLVLVALQLALVHHPLRPVRQRPLELLLRVLKARLGAPRVGLRTFPMIIRGSITNPCRSTAKGASSSGNAATMAGIPYGVAGLLGAVVAAVFV